MGYIIDISEHNTITDWAAAAKDLDAVIIRMGYRGSIAGRPAYKKITEDAKYRQHLAAAQKYKIPYGVYFFPTSVTDEEAAEEAAWIRDRVRGLQLCVPVFLDSENVLKNRTARADKLSRADRTHVMRVLTDRLISYGITCGIYSYTSWLQHDLDLSQLQTVVRVNTWIAQTPKLTYKGSAVIWQYGKKKFPWTAAPVDVDKIVGKFDMTVKEKGKEKKEEKMVYYRYSVVEAARGYIDAAQGSKQHKEIVDRYNKQSPLPRGYCMTYTDAWCATFVSSIALKCGYTAIIPTECSCGFMVDKAKKMGIWQESDSYVPEPGDIVMYDWDDNGKGDDTGWPDHTGIVEASGSGKIVVIEGNAGSASRVARRTLAVNGKYIRGYITPKYTADKPSEAVKDGWKKTDGVWYYYRDGKKLTGWHKLPWSKGSDWFFFDANGKMLTGWQKDGGKMYYLSPSTGALMPAPVESDGAGRVCYPG